MNFLDLYREIAEEGSETRWDKGIDPELKLYVEKHFAKGSYILDHGCWRGHKTIDLVNMGYKVLGVDIIENALKDAKKLAQKVNVNIDFALCDIVRLPYKTGNFDGIFSSGTLHSIYVQEKNGEENKLDETVKEMARILREDGISFCCVPFYLCRLFPDSYHFLDYSEHIVFKYPPEIFIDELNKYFSLIEEPMVATRTTPECSEKNIIIIGRKK
jgi:SAM-dependent methyltransferase